MDTLKGLGPLSIFAPTDEAFAKIPKADLDKLLANKTKLKSVQGAQLTISTACGVMVDKAKVVAADVAADNGVIHAIDTVLMPK